MRCLNCQQEGLSTTADLCPQCGVHLPSLLRDLLPPGILLHGDKYRLDYALGRGGFGITYRATHLALDQLVAIKEFFPHEHCVRDISAHGLSVPSSKQETFERSLRRFMSEGRVLARLSHTNVVRVQDLFEEHDTGYLVMDLVAGPTLEVTMQRSGRLGKRQTWTIIDLLVSALGAVHDQGIYHLDIKPENVLLGPNDRPVLIDFGASRQGLGTQRSQSFTLEYAAPEVIAGREIGPESDVFELGMMAYEMVTGEKAPAALSRLAGNETWEPRGLPEPWQVLLASALRLKKADRPTDIRAWWASQKPPEPTVAPPPPPPVPIVLEHKPADKGKKVAFVTAFTAVVIIAVITGLLAIVFIALYASESSDNAKLRLDLTQRELDVSNLTRGRETLERTLAEEKSKLQALRKRIASKFPLMISDIQLYNVDNQRRSSPHKSSFSYQEVYFVNFDVTLQNNLEETLRGVLFFKYYRPDGTVQWWADKPYDSTGYYTGKTDFTVGPDATARVSSGHGNTEGTYFQRGIHRIEFWYAGKKIDEKSFTITN